MLIFADQFAEVQQFESQTFPLRQFGPDYNDFAESSVSLTVIQYYV